MSSGTQAMQQYIRNRPGTEALSLRKRLSAVEALEQVRQAGRTPSLPIEFTSQYGEDCWLWELFRGQRDGFYIEVGAFDGYTFSVSYAFEAIGWKGLLIEPIPERCDLARARRPGSRVVNAAVAGPGSSGTCTFTIVDGPWMGLLSYLTARSPEGLGEWVAPDQNAPTRKVTVPLTSLAALLEEHAGPIDFAVLDVEGGEVPLIDGFDLNRFRPRVLMIEEGMPGETSPVPQHMTQFPYTPVAYPWINRVYIRNDEQHLISRARGIPVW